MVAGRGDGAARLVFLLDVDNTLLDNDRLKSDLAEEILGLLGAERAAAFWEIYEEVRKDEDYVDYPTTVRRWVARYNDQEAGQKLETALDAIDFASYLYPHVLDALAYLRRLGTAVILSDGDQVFQPLKIRRSGLEAAVDHNVLIYVHKELELPRVFARYPADHYVVVDDKPRILAALEDCCPTTFTTILVLQGKYAVEGEYQPAPDFVLGAIADLTGLTYEQFTLGMATPEGSTTPETT